MKKVLEILECEDKKTTAGKDYARFKTSEGWMSCFDKKSIKELKEKVGESVNVEVATSGDFQNIKKYLGEASEEVAAEVQKVAQNGSNGGFPVAMKVSYAKDAFCHIISRISQQKFDTMADQEAEVLKLMDIAVAAIKKAEDKFQ